MNRRNGYKVKKKNGGSRFRMVLLMLSLVVMAGVSFITYQYHRDPKHYPVLQAFSVRLDTWWAERKTRIQAKVAKSKEMANAVVATKVKTKTKASEAEPIHFEFYTMLPKENVQQVDTQMAEKKEKPETIFSQDALEREFASQITKTAYVIQTAIFSNLASAEKTRQDFAGEGLASKVVKAYMEDHLVYRVQFGPYEEKNQINDVQTKLASHGVHFSLHKTGEKLA